MLFRSLLQKMIEDVILANISEGQRMLDVGCGDGASTKLFSGKAEEVVGIDYMPGLLEIAEKQNLLANISYHQGNVLDLSDIRQKFGVFDVVSSIRCLINLSTWEEQAQGLKEIARMVKPHGLYAASEGWSDGRAGLNARRAQCGLHEMPVVFHNLFIDREQFLNEASKYFEFVEYRSFGMYLFTSRVLQPLMVHPEEPTYDHPINVAAAQAQTALQDEMAFSDCDFTGVYVLRRKARD